LACTLPWGKIRASILRLKRLEFAMPIYEYQCEACGEVHEALQKISDAPLEVCPHCEKSALRKKVTAAAFRLSGGGWYETDFKTGDKKKNLSGDKSGEGKPADSKSADSKPAEKKSADKTSSSGDSGAGKSKAAGN